ncbi:hypothetical protein V6N13_074401 [Hibiscus sabdariffa]
MQSEGLRGIELLWITGSMVLLYFANLEARETEMAKGSLTKWRLNWFRCLWWKVGIRGRRAGGVVPVVTVDSGTEEEEISASCSSPRW